ncbi:hypothetical protein R6Q57_007933 [Mikania cordata]
MRRMVKTINSSQTPTGLSVYLVVNAYPKRFRFLPAAVAVAVAASGFIFYVFFFPFAVFATKKHGIALCFDSV